LSYAAKEMRRLTGKAISAFRMIADGNRVMVAVSGGFDSISLLWLLRERLKRIPISYDIVAVHVDLGFGLSTGRRMEEFFLRHGFDYTIINTTFGPHAHSHNNRENPCFLCSRLKRKAIFQKAAELKCDTLAFGHHKDDFIETFFLNLLFSGSVSTMQPVQPFFNGALTLIRPLYLIDEAVIKRYAREMEFPVIESGCPTAGSSMRTQIKSLLTGLYHTNKKVKGNIFHAVQTAEGIGESIASEL
jgi:tRNA 2-thiocytidine biosynthesis protein TtcA